jgi:hypothetical protein
MHSGMSLAQSRSVLMEGEFFKLCNGRISTVTASLANRRQGLQTAAARAPAGSFVCVCLSLPITRTSVLLLLQGLLICRLLLKVANLCLTCKLPVIPLHVAVAVDPKSTIVPLE